MHAPDPKVSNFTFRQALRGEIAFDKLPLHIVHQIQAMQRRYARMQRRWMLRHNKAFQYAAVGLNGKRAVARRLRQIAAGQLQVSQ